MDNAGIKKLLQSFRIGTQDSDDPIFREALEQLESDPALVVAATPSSPEVSAAPSPP